MHTPLQPHELKENRQYTTMAYCLKSWPYGESDRIVHLFSADYGKVSAIVKGAKKPNSKLSGACELLHLISVQLSRGKNLDLLNQYQSIQSFPGIRQDILKLALAQVFAEEAYVLVTEFEPDSSIIFDLLTEHLNALEKASTEAILPIGSRFQLKLLETAGYQPSLTNCVLSGEPLSQEALYYPFSVPLGGAILSKDVLREHMPPEADLSTYTWVNVSTKTLFALDTVSQAPIEQMVRFQWTSEDALKMQKFIQFYMSQKLEHTYQSFTFLLSVI